MEQETQEYLTYLRENAHHWREGYQDYIARKLAGFEPCGIEPPESMPALFDFQEALTKWALRLGRAAIFADTGLGKTRMQLQWADAVSRHAGGSVLILAPLAVAEQTVEEGAAIGVGVEHHREQPDILPAIVITNYERLHRFDASQFVGVVLDESSIIKHHDSKTLALLLDAFRHTPFKLCATATPAPNDWTELGTHAEFLGVCTRSEMLSEFFVHDGGETQVWRLKGHAKREFWRWVSSWGALVRSPADLGFDASRYDLPKLTVEQHTIYSDQKAPEGMLFALEAQTLMERRSARKESIQGRVRACARMIAADVKLAESQQSVSDDALEEGIRREPEEEGRVEPGVQSETKSSGNASGPGSAESLYARVLSREQAQAKASDAGAAGAIQREPASEVCNRRGRSRSQEGGSEGLAGGEPGKTEGPEAEEVWHSRCGLQGNAGDAEWPVRDLRPRRREQSEVLSGGGPLPRDGEDSGPALHQLQSGSREVQGRHSPAVQRGSLSGAKWLIWCELNTEQDALERELKANGISCVSIQGSTPLDKRIELERAWRLGPVSVLISKPSVFGFGLNWQHCHQMAFVGVTDSFESYYQAVRRCWRFGQSRPVQVHIFASELEGAVVANLQRKERDARAMSESLAAETAESVQANVLGTQRNTIQYTAGERIAVPDFLGSA